MADYESAEAAAKHQDELDALRAEVEAHKRSRQIDANEARSREMELRAEVERLAANRDLWRQRAITLGWPAGPLTVTGYCETMSQGPDDPAGR